jgi:hypothetical protein
MSEFDALSIRELRARGELRDAFEVVFGDIDDRALDALKDQLEDRGWRFE